MVLKSGKNVYPEELEEIVGKLPFVSECMVYGKKKEDDLLVSCKIVYSKEFFRDTMPDADEEEIFSYMKKEIVKINDTLPGYKHIKHLNFQTEALIKTSTAKVKRYEEMKKEEE